MNSLKISLGVVLAVLAAVGFGFFCFISFYFETLGDMQSSLIKASIFSVLLLVFALLAKKFKQVSRNFRTYIFMEWGALFLFGFVALLAIFPFSHFFVVTQQNDVIKEKIITSIEQTEDMIVKYENYKEDRLDMYREELKTAVAGKRTRPSDYRAFGFINPPPSDEVQINNMMFTLRGELSKDSVGTHAYAQKIARSRNAIARWNPIEAIRVVNMIENDSKMWLDKFVKNSEHRQPNETYDVNFSYHIRFDDLTPMFRNTATSVTVLSILFAIIAYLLMMLQYIVTDRHTRFPGLNLVFKSESVNNQGEIGRNIIVD